MKLYKVEVTFETVVLAKDQKEAEHEAMWAVKMEDDEAEDIYATVIQNENDLPHGWDIECCPWGKNKEGYTIKQILNNAKS